MGESLMRFDNQVIAVTGGAQGLGLAIVEQFIEEGAQVTIIDIHQKAIDQALHSLSSDSVDSICSDVTDAAQVDEIISTIKEKHGRIDVLVNNAGIIRDNVIWKMPEEDYDSVMKVNLKGPWLMCREVAPIMRSQNSGRIVNIASRSWLGNVGQSNYSASKGGLVSMTRVLALELGKNNITVNAVAPGLIDTPMTRSLDPEVYKMLEQSNPCKKAGKPADIAHTVAFLSSDEAGFINGQVIHVDGGKSIGASVQ
jgi:NAD(P)-dependent dehydrogenase (short-subunit alcohol dehydrogenase family)